MEMELKSALSLTNKTNGILVEGLAKCLRIEHLVNSEGQSHHQENSIFLNIFERKFGIRRILTKFDFFDLEVQIQTKIKLKKNSLILPIEGKGKGHGYWILMKSRT